MKKTWFRIGALISILNVSIGCAIAQKKSDESETVASSRTTLAVGNLPWTLETARKELTMRPSDPYMQFVVAQLEYAEGKVKESPASSTGVAQWRERRAQAAARSRNADLFNIFSGALAVQESLQLDAMTNVNRGENGEATVLTASLSGPTVKSHPWSELLGGRNPPVSALANCVPADQLYVRFGSVSKLLQMQDLGEQYATYVTTQTKQRAYKANRIAEIQKQLALEATPLLAPIYDAAVEELAITSSDLYFVDGNDVTVVMQLRQPKLIRMQLDRMLSNAAASDTKAVRESGDYLGVSFDHVRSSNRTIHVYSAYPKPNLHVRSNSLVALKRTISTILGKPFEGEEITPLGSTEEFRYIRTLMPLGEVEEDGLVYFSDPFIRRVIGPEQKLTQRSRLICKHQLQMITFASLLYQSQYGQRPTSLQQLKARGCLGSTKRPLTLQCPAGGQLTLAEDGHRGCCSHHGCFHSLNPVNEIVREKVTDEEAKQYGNFVEQYSQYWTTFFDPIAIRLQHGAKRTRVETIVLPLINNSIYQSLAATLGGEPESLDPPLVTSGTIFSIAARLDKHKLLEIVGIGPPEPSEAASTKANENARQVQQEIVRANMSLRQIALGMLNFEAAYRHYPPNPKQPPVQPTGTQQAKDPAGLSWRVQILPFIEQGELYSAFHLDEPWDSEHNKSLIAKMPKIFAVGIEEQDAAQGKTRILRPFHPQALHSSHTLGARIGSVTDGTSNTISVVLADSDQSVVWTRPDDLEVGLGDPRKGWSKGIDGVTFAAFADGSVAEIHEQLTAAEARMLLTRAGGELLARELREKIRRTQRSRAPRNPFAGLPEYEYLQLPELLYEGIGNQIAIHVCDDDPLIDFSVARFMGMMGGSFNGRGNMFFSETGMFAVLAMSMNAPVYISVPVKDAAIVDAFLSRFDDVLAQASRENTGQSGGFIEVELDNYRFTDSADDGVRAFAFRFGPLTWRFYWSRIGDGVFVASKPGIIRDLRAADLAGTMTPGQAVAQEPSHGSVRVRPKNWKAVLPHYQIGWAESERLACLNNLGCLADLARVGKDGGARDSLDRLAQEVFHAQYTCPCGGVYSHAGDGAAQQCSVHGSLQSPRQPSKTGTSAIGSLTERLSDVQLQIQFLEDGLHATVTIDRE